MRTFPIKNLYYEFIKGSDLEGFITAIESARRLESVGLIELVPDKRTGEIGFYRWIKTKKVSRPELESMVRTALVGEL